MIFARRRGTQASCIATILVSALAAAPLYADAAGDGRAPTSATLSQGGTELRGKVTRAEGQVVWIAMESQMWPRIGDPVKLEQVVGGVAMTMRGTWVVAEVAADSVRAEPGPAARGNPARDYAALITSANPQPRPVATGTGGGARGGGARGGGAGDPIDLDEVTDLYNSLVAGISDEPTRDEVRARADAGDRGAQTQMGVWCYNGDGVPQSYEEARPSTTNPAAASRRTGIWRSRATRLRRASATPRHRSGASARESTGGSRPHLQMRESRA